MSKHQLYEYPAAVLQSLSPVSLLERDLAGGGGVVAGCRGDLATVFHRTAAHYCHRVTASKVLSVHHHRHLFSLLSPLLSYLSTDQIEKVLIEDTTPDSNNCSEGIQNKTNLK